MSSVNRATLPQNFLDSVTTGLTLPQPEPQYFFAKMAMAGRLSTASINAGASTVQQYVSMAGGGAPVSPLLAEMARAADAYPGAVIAVEGFGKNGGDTMKIPRDIYSGGGYDEASRQVQTDKTTSTTGQSIAMEEAVITLKEFEGPYSTASSAVQPYAIREFDARYRHNKQQLAGLVTRHLRRDYIKWLDGVVSARFRGSKDVTTNVTYMSDSVTSVASYTSGAGYGFNLDAFLRAKKALSDREWSPFPNGRYMAIVPTKFNVDMVQDSQYRDLARQSGPADAKNPIFGYIGSIQEIDFFECTTLPTAAAATTVAGGTVPTSVTVLESFLLGPGVVAMGNAMDPSAFFADDTDYGKVAKVIWRAIQGFQTVDNRGLQRLLSQ